MENRDGVFDWTETRMFSKTVRSLKMLRIWKERAMPWFAI